MAIGGMQKITFEVVQVPCVDEDNMPCRRAWVTATLEGKSVGTSGVPVDFFQLLAYRGLSGERSLLTCSCGVGGCAGFFHEGALAWGPDTVTWLLHAQEYAEFLPDLLPSEADPVHLKLVFDTSQLSAALDALDTQLRALLSGGPVHLAPGYDTDPLLSAEELDEDLAAQRDWYGRSEARKTREAEVFGWLTGVTVHATFTNGHEREANAANVLGAILRIEADQAGMVLLEEADEYVDMQVANEWLPRLQSSPGLLLSLMKAQDWNDAAYWFHTIRPPLPDLEAGQTAPELWAGVTLTLSGQP